MTRPKVFLTGGDDMGWALDEDLRLTRRALEGFADFTDDIATAEVVHAMWWYGLLDVPRDQLIGKRVICHVPGEPFRYLAVPEHRKAVPLVGAWIVRSKEAQKQFESVGVSAHIVPYTVDTAIFRPLSPDDSDCRALREQWSIAADSYVIGSFQRDTEGADLVSPKLVKGPDVFAEIVNGVHQRGKQIHVLLAGPRRHWLRRKLDKLGVPYTFFGQLTDDDDVAINTLGRDSLNLLYNVVDVYIVSSRSEGGPQAVLEAAAARCKIVSTRVGLANDVLEPTSIYSSPHQAIDLLCQDIDRDVLALTIDRQQERIQANHTLAASVPHFQQLYERVPSIPAYSEPPLTSRKATAKRGILSRARRRFKLKPAPPFTVGLWHTFFEPPYGGGNQFMLALRSALLGRGTAIVENELARGIDAYILNSIHFDVERFVRFKRRNRLNVVHRVDGPIHLIRGFDREKDELCFELNQQFANVTIVQSAWTLERIVEMGYQPVQPVIIHNAVDPAIFHPDGRVAFDPGRKIRLISSSWSNNPRKGGPTYKWIEDHLDWDRFDYTFVGAASEKFERIHQIDPVPSQQLAGLLRQHDIYITASMNDPCSNALIEALSCGLPALYLNDGGHPELVRLGGLPFESRDEILPQLERLAANYTMYQNLITAPKMDDVADKYLALLKDAANA